MSTPELILALYVAGIVVAAFVVGFFRIRLGGMPIGVFAALWPIVLPLAIFDTATEKIADFAHWLRDRTNREEWDE